MCTHVMWWQSWPNRWEESAAVYQGWWPANTCLHQPRSTSRSAAAVAQSHVCPAGQQQQLACFAKQLLNKPGHNPLVMYFAVQGVTSETDFEWMSQLRYSWEHGDVSVGLVYLANTVHCVASLPGSSDCLPACIRTLSNLRGGATTFQCMSVCIAVDVSACVMCACNRCA
jgi:hypothetical protein